MQPQSWRTTPCRLSTTAYSIYSELPTIWRTFLHGNLRTRHAEVTVIHFTGHKHERSDFPLRHRCQGQSYSRESTTSVTLFVRKLMCMYNSSFSQVAEPGVYDIWQQSCIAVAQQIGNALTLNQSTCLWPTDHSNCTTSTVHCKFQHLTILSPQVLPLLVRILLYLVCHKLCPMG